MDRKGRLDLRTRVRIDQGLFARNVDLSERRGRRYGRHSFLNGHRIADVANAFLRHRLEVKPYLRQGTNRIRIEFASPEKAALAESKKLAYPVPHGNAVIQSPHRNLLRKPQCHGGWDWGPCLMACGIYDSIYLAATSLARIEHVAARQRHFRDRVEVEVLCEVESIGDGECPFEVALGDQRANSKAALRKGSNLLHHKFRISQPKLWWPTGYGEQPLYDLTVKVGKEVRHQRIGLRTLEVNTKADKVGRPLEFIVNGVPIFCKGANWIPADALPQRQTREVINDLLTSAVKANMNMIRVWGGGRYETDFFYDFCDEKGLLVWQDFMFACSMYPATDAFLEQVRNEAVYQVKRLRHHPSLAIWCGDNENLAAFAWFEESRKNRDRYLVDYVRINEGILAEAVRTHDGERMFWPSSPCGGPGDYSGRWDNDANGDMHYWGVWHDGKPFEDYLRIQPRFCSEFGYQSFPSLDTIRSFAPESEWNVSSPTMEHHQRNPAGNTRIVETFLRYFRFPKDFESIIYLSQLQQALAMKTAVDHFRSLRPRCMGALYWQLNDVWPAASWSSLEYGGKWKLLHYVARRFYAPIALSTKKLENNGVEIWAANDRGISTAGVLTVRALDFLGHELWRNRLTVKLPAAKALRIKRYETMKGLPDISRAFLSLELAVAGETSRAEHYFCPYKNCELAPARVHAEIEARGEAFLVSLTTNRPALWLALNADGIPGEFDDNCITLLPDRPRKLIFSPRRKTSLQSFRASLHLRHLRDAYE